ncbi:RNA polymerase subunit sigma-70, partial [Streptomyces sp. SID9913]|nr:RNA polymerase subunit sigma-70 [Streptomyces sp. SID9913]
MRERHVLQGVRRDREFAAFVAGAAGRLLHAATLLTAEDPDDN